MAFYRNSIFLLESLFFLQKMAATMQCKHHTTLPILLKEEKPNKKQNLVLYIYIRTTSLLLFYVWTVIWRLQSLLIPTSKINNWHLEKSKINNKHLLVYIKTNLQINWVQYIDFVCCGCLRLPYMRAGQHSSLTSSDLGKIAHLKMFLKIGSYN